MPDDNAKANDSATPQDGAPVVPTVNWDDGAMRTTYANVVNASSTREEVNVFFGTNQTWSMSEKKEFDVQLSDRMVLNPYAAKRLHLLLGVILGTYEKRFGELKIDGTGLDKK